MDLSNGYTCLCAAMLLIVAESRGASSIKFVHKMYPVTINSRHPLLTLLIYRSAKCTWNMNNRKVPEVDFPEYSKNRHFISFSVNASKYLRDNEYGEFKCSCSLQKAGQLIKFNLIFQALRHENFDLPKSRGFLRMVRDEGLYPLFDRCMERNVSFRSFYHFYLNHNESDLYAPHPCFKKGTVVLKPNLIIQRDVIDSPEYRSLLRCHFRGFPKPRTEIYLNGKTPSNDSFRAGEFKASAKKDGMYTCKATNQHGTNYMTIMKYSVEKTALVTRLSVKEKVIPLHKNLQMHLRCPPDKLSDTIEHVIWAKVSSNDTLVRFVAENIYQIKIHGQNLGEYICLACWTNECIIYRFPRIGEDDVFGWEATGKSIFPDIGGRFLESSTIRPSRDIGGRFFESSTIRPSRGPGGHTSRSTKESTLPYETLDGWQLGFWVAVGSVVLIFVVFFFIFVTLCVRYASDKKDQRKSKLPDNDSYTDISTWKVKSIYDYSRTPITYQVNLTNVRKNSSASESLPSCSSNVPLNSRRSSQQYLYAPIHEAEEYVSMRPADMIEPSLTGDRFRLSRSSLQSIRSLGEGAFGQVTLARILVGPLQNRLVAIKELKDNTSDYLNVSSLLHEVQALKTIGPHPYVIRLLGASVEPNTPFMATEYCENGSLRNFLRSMQNRPDEVEEKQLKSFVCQVARGMDFVASKQFLHCDLATRNVFLTEHFVCKIADFGMARRVGEGDHIASDIALPIRWLAPEVIIERKLSRTSDVWSFGVLVWEVYSLGLIPYHGFGNNEICDVLARGHRMSRPDLCPGMTWRIVEDAWSALPADRPPFSIIVRRLENEGGRRFSTISYRRRGSMQVSTSSANDTLKC